MQKIVVDTNVIVSALIQRSFPFLIIDELFLENKIELCVSEDLAKEHFEVLNRPKFSRFQDFHTRAEYVLSEIASTAKWYVPKNKIDLISDKDDNMILELAEESKAHFIITGNTNDFTFKEFHETKIVSPREYWENHRPN